MASDLVVLGLGYVGLPLAAGAVRAGLSVVWPEYLYIAFTGGLFLLLALTRFRASAVQSS